MRITLIACMSRNRVIGRAGGMPWRMPSDLRHFKAATLGKPLIMGRKTFESIGRALPGRRTIVVSRQPSFRAPGVEVAPTLDTALDRVRAAQADDVMIAGGGEIYALALPLATHALLTELAVDLEGDAYFPPLDPTQWREVGRKPLVTGAGDDYPAQVLDFERF
jgi:dihydrofolate reductase